jgi:FkbM family methyltransferase
VGRRRADSGVGTPNHPNGSFPATASVVIVCPYATPLVSHAQIQEDLVLYRALSGVRRGFYIDVGAQHPVVSSVTKLFYERGWHGINIEPVPSWFELLVKDRPRDLNLRLAASPSPGEVTLHEFLDTALSTVVDLYADRHREAGRECRSYAVPSRRLDHICDEHVGGDIHFLKIDAEGAEREILLGCDFTRFRPWIVVIEATEPLTDTPTYMDWQDIMLRAGYEFAATDALNRYYVSREHSKLKRPLEIAVKRPAGPFVARRVMWQIGNWPKQLLRGLASRLSSHFRGLFRM